MLRQAIANLAAPAEAQDAYLVSILGHLAPDGGRGYGNDELALELGDSFGPAPDMLECGEITQEQIDAVLPLDALLEKWSGKENSDFWIRDALWTDPRWEEARLLARQALKLFPEDESGELFGGQSFRVTRVAAGPGYPESSKPRSLGDAFVRLMPLFVLLHLGSCAADLMTEQYSLIPIFCSITSSPSLGALVVAIPLTALASFLAAVIAGACRQTRFFRPIAWAYLALLALLVLELALYAANAGSFGCDGP